MRDRIMKRTAELASLFRVATGRPIKERDIRFVGALIPPPPLIDPTFIPVRTRSQ